MRLKATGKLTSIYSAHQTEMMRPPNVRRPGGLGKPLTSETDNGKQHLEDMIDVPLVDGLLVGESL